MHRADRIRNVALVGHRGSGKTSVNEALLFQAGAVNRLGTVLDGTTASDSDPDEQGRQMSISASLSSFEWDDRKINLIDTPGEPSFIADALGALRVCESAIFVVNAVMGVEVNTTRLWQRAEGARQRAETAEGEAKQARDGLEQATAAHPGAPVTIVGHSMGGRTALRVAGDERVEGVCALAPWIEPGEPTAHLTRVRLLIAHGTVDRVTDPAAAAAFAAATGARFVPVAGDGHAMLRHPVTWHRLVREFLNPSATNAAPNHPCPATEG